MAKKTFAKTRLLDKVKINVGDKTLIAAAVAAVLIGISFIIAVLAPSSGIGNFYSASMDINIDLKGTGALLLLTNFCTYDPYTEDMWSQLDFKGQLVDSQGACNLKKNWRVYCTNVTAGSTGGTEVSNGQGYCNCLNSGAAIAPTMELFKDQSKRDSQIAQTNNGNAESHDDEIMELSKQAEALHCGCEVISTDAAVQSPYKTVSINGISTNIYQAAGVSGTKELVQKWGVLLNKMNTIDPVTKVCTALPPGCSVMDSYSNRGDNHSAGIAIDIACGEMATPVGQGCTGKTLEALNKIKKFNTSFNIIRECNKLERNIENPSGKFCPGDGTNFQVIHLDLNFDPIKRGNPPGQTCLWTNCNWGAANCGKATE